MILDYVEDIINFVKDEPEFTAEVTKMEVYLKNIQSATVEEIDKMNKGLIQCMTKINTRFDCLFHKLKSIRQVIDKCENGEAIINKLFQVFLNNLHNIPNYCHEYDTQITRETFDLLIEKSMKFKNLQVNCIRNNPTKLKLACMQHQSGLSNDEIIKIIENVTVDDIEYFISNCKKGKISKNEEKAICSLKELGVDLETIIIQYKQFDENEISNIFATKCLITDLLKERMCAMKMNGETLDEIQNTFTGYSAREIESVLEICVKEITPSDKKQICNLKELGFDINETNALWEVLFSKYSRQIVVDHYAQCS